MSEYSKYAPTCNLTCETVGNSCTNRTIANAGCYCKVGYVKNCQGVCVLISSYCRSCKTNEYYTDCGPNPESSCQTPKAISTSTIPGCVCNKGLLRDYNNSCVTQDKCPSKILNNLFLLKKILN